MKRLLRAAAVAVPAAASIALGTAAPGYAAGGGTFNGQAHIPCFGCGVSSGTASLSFSGVANGKVIVLGPMNATFTDTEQSTTCPVMGTANGSFTGALNGTFTWSRVGATAIITTSGDLNGVGVAAFVVVQPKGLPCGGPVTADVVGSVAGT